MFYHVTLNQCKISAGTLCISALLVNNTPNITFQTAT